MTVESSAATPRSIRIPGLVAPATIVVPHKLTLRVHPASIAFMDDASGSGLSRHQQIAGMRRVRGVGQHDLHIGAAIAAASLVPPITITHTLPALWQLQIPAGVAPNTVRVSYEMHALVGEFQTLSNSHNQDSCITITLRPLPVRRVDPVSRQFPNQGNVEMTFEGGVKITLSLDHIRYAGTYKGTCVMTLEML